MKKIDFKKDRPDQSEMILLSQQLHFHLLHLDALVFEATGKNFPHPSTDAKDVFGNFDLLTEHITKLEELLGDKAPAFSFPKHLMDSLTGADVKPAVTDAAKPAAQAKKPSLDAEFATFIAANPDYRADPRLPKCRPETTPTKK